MATPVLAHNSYFDGQVQSIGFERHGRRASVGVMAPGEFHFGTGGPERMVILSGELAARPDGGSWSHYPAGTAFEIAGGSGFDVRVERPCAYLCEFL
jgi:purine/pyrimidine-nucleoside phosphorylase